MFLKNVDDARFTFFWFTVLIHYLRELRTALDRPLKTKEGKMVFYIALWYQHGNPLMGRMWEERGRLSATFTE